MLHLDYETRSPIDLKTQGLDNYARNPRTEILCAGYAFGDGPIELWVPGQPVPEHIIAWIQQGGTLCAHNAKFEHAITTFIAPRYGWPVPRLSQWICTAALSLYSGLPAKLELAAHALGLSEQKDEEGHRLMLKMCRPRRGRYLEDAASLQRLYVYCKQDVRVERELHRHLRPLSSRERALFLIDWMANARGIAVDSDLMERATRAAATEAAHWNQVVERASGGRVTSTTQAGKIRQAVGINSVAKNALKQALEAATGTQEWALLNARSHGAKSSVAKLASLRQLVSEDGRLRYTLQYHGAFTGRWAGRGFQPQNLPRQTYKHPQVEAIIKLLPDCRAIDQLHGDPLDAISQCLRGLLVASPGYIMLSGDYAQIEGRVLAWLAGEAWKLKAYYLYDLDLGPDLYVVAYSKSFGVAPHDVTPAQRQIGKVQELALGYQGGKGAFLDMARVYGISGLPEAEAESIKEAWRQAHPNVVRFWYANEAAAIRALEAPGEYRAGPIVYYKEKEALMCRLPSGRTLRYPNAKIVEIETPWGAFKPAASYMAHVTGDLSRVHIITDPRAKGPWMRIATYGGSLVEKVVQATARDIMAASMVRLAGAMPDYRLLMSVHDEIVSEAPQKVADLDQYRRIMREPPTWATGLPINVSAWAGHRYRK